MLTAAELAWMRDTQELAHPGTAYIQRATFTSDGMGGYTEAWVSIGTVTARWGVPTNGREPVTGDQPVSSNDWTISVPHDAAVQAKDRIVQVGSNKIYEVTFVPNGQSYKRPSIYRLQCSTRRRHRRMGANLRMLYSSNAFWPASGNGVQGRSLLPRLAAQPQV